VDEESLVVDGAEDVDSMGDVADEAVIIAEEFP